VTAVDAVNLDTSSATGFVAEGSIVRGLLRAFVQGRPMIMCAAARTEFLIAMSLAAGPIELARGGRFLSRVNFVPDDPSHRVATLRTTKNVNDPDRIIFGTGDKLGIVTMTGDGKFVRAAAGQGVVFSVFIHPPARFQGT
jgi:hypothetical protein